MTQEHIDEFVKVANSTNKVAREISIKKLKEAGLDKDGKPIMNIEESNRDFINHEIIDNLYNINQTFVSKAELIEKGFDFSQWFTSSSQKHYFDKEEGTFEYKDFLCGEYFIKTRDKNLENPSQNSRVFFQIIKIDFDNVRINAELKLALKLLKDRKFTHGSWWASTFESELRDESLAQQSEEKLKLINDRIKLALPRLKKIIDDFKKNQDLFSDLYERLQKEETGDEKWL